MDPEDNWMIHAADTLREGELLADYTRVELCKNAPDAVNELIDWGARFQRGRWQIDTQRFFGAHTYRRTVFYEDWTGQEIVRVLMDQVRKHKIEFADTIYVTRLLTSDDLGTKRSVEDIEVKGVVLGINIEKKEFVLFVCKSLILAAGGYTRVYSVSSSRVFENYGDGMALAYEAGAELVDMEMVKFHPTGMVWPEKALGTLATEAIRGEGGILLNSKGERFMKNYYPERIELGPQDTVARVDYNEIIAGRGTEHGGVWLDITNLSKEKILDRLPTMYEQFKNLAGIDISQEKMEVGPTAYYSMGGVVVNTNCSTKRIAGLFAVGEVISQIHGANRLGGNSLLDTVVFGKIVGRKAAKFAKKEGNEISKESSLALLADVNNPTEFKAFIVNEPFKFRSEIQVMTENAGIIREVTKL